MEIQTSVSPLTRTDADKTITGLSSCWAILSDQEAAGVLSARDAARSKAVVLSELHTATGGGKQYTDACRRLVPPVTRSTAYKYVHLTVADDGPATVPGLADLIKRGRRDLGRARAGQISDRGQDAPRAVRERVLCRDSLGWLRAQPDRSVDNFVCDPPFGVGKAYRGFTDPKTPKEYREFIAPFWAEMCRVVRDRGMIVMQQGRPHLRYLEGWFRGSRIHMHCFQQRSQRVIAPWVLWSPGRPLSDDWTTGTGDRVTGDTSADLDHECPLPVGAALNIIDRHIRRGEQIVDPFCGAGGILVAAHVTGHPYIGIDVRRLCVRTARGRLAELEASG
jgi:hypothetical protein